MVDTGTRYSAAREPKTTPSYTQSKIRPSSQSTIGDVVGIVVGAYPRNDATTAVWYALHYLDLIEVFSDLIP